LLEVIRELSIRDERGDLCIRCLVRRSVLFEPLVGVIATDVKGWRGSSLE
jgi:hypothetical protein